MEESTKQAIDRAVALHEEGEAGVFGVDGYRFGESGTLLLHFVVHAGAGEDIARLGETLDDQKARGSAGVFHFEGENRYRAEQAKYKDIVTRAGVRME